MFIRVPKSDPAYHYRQIASEKFVMRPGDENEQSALVTVIEGWADTNIHVMTDLANFAAMWCPLWWVAAPASTQSAVHRLDSLGGTKTCDPEYRIESLYNPDVSGRENARIIMRSLHPDWDALMTIVNTAWMSDKDPRLVNYAEMTKVGMRAKSATVSKFLQMLNRKWGFRFSDEYIQEEAETIPQLYKELELKVSFYTDPDDIEYYYGEGGAGFGSCMSYEPYVRFYGDQENVSLMILRNESGRIAGRALVWRNVDEVNRHGEVQEEGFTIMDRIYPSNGGAHINWAIRYAKEQGWLYKRHQSLDAELSRDGIYRVGIEDTGYYPYMDTFSYSVTRPKYLYTSSILGKRTYGWHSTEGWGPGGYDEDGYDRDGYDRDGYDRDGYNHEGYDREGYDDWGYDSDGYDREGYNDEGRDEEGYDDEGYDRDGIDRDGNPREGEERDGDEGVGLGS